MPANPEKEGYQFEGWFEGESFFDFNKKVVEENILIYAKWAQFTYTVTFVSQTVGLRSRQQLSLRLAFY